MKKFFTPVVLSLGLMSSLAMAKSFQRAEASFIPGEAVVKLRPGQLKNFNLRKTVLGLEIKRNMNLIAGDFVLVKSNQKSIHKLIEELKSLPEVAYAEPNFIYKAISTTTTDPMFEKLWGLKNNGNNEPNREGNYSGVQGVVGADVNAEKAWQITKGSKKVVIAVIDTGIDYNHPDLSDNIWSNPNEIAGNQVDDDGNGYVDDVHGWNAFAKNGNPMDGNAHGTHCAGTIGASHDNNVGVAGVMSEVQMMAVKFLSDQGSGSLADAIDAINYATKMNVDLMSNSWGGGGFSQALEDSIKAANERGILFVAAAGNSSTNNDSSPHYPSNYQVNNVISVAAHTVSDNLATFSCFGKRTVHVAAPGHNILSTVPGNKYAVYSGTSMATPHVSGVLGLLLSKEGRLPVDEVRNRLMATTVPVGAYRKKTISGGRVDAYNLLTDTRTPREEPSESAWRTESLSDVFETKHPYGNNEKFSKTYRFPGAKYVKLVIEKFDLESGYDFLTLKDANGAVIEKVSGAGQNYGTDYAETDSVTVEFTSDSSTAKWGVVVKEVKVIY